MYQVPPTPPTSGWRKHIYRTPNWHHGVFYAIPTTICVFLTIRWFIWLSVIINGSQSLVWGLFALAEFLPSAAWQRAGRLRISAVVVMLIYLVGVFIIIGMVF